MSIHNSKLCSVCKRVGDFDITHDTTAFFSAHETAGIHLQINRSGEVVELGFNKRQFLSEANGYLNAIQATNEPGRITQHLVDLKRLTQKTLKGTK